jgi:transposase-like protein
MLGQVQAINNANVVILIKMATAEKKCPPVKAGKPKIGPRERN